MFVAEVPCNSGAVSDAKAIDELRTNDDQNEDEREDDDNDDDDAAGAMFRKIFCSGAALKLRRCARC